MMPATITVTSTTTSVALSRFSSKIPTSVPMVTAASVAAAWAMVRPNTSLVSVPLKPARRPPR